MHLSQKDGEKVKLDIICVRVEWVIGLYMNLNDFALFLKRTVREQEFLFLILTVTSQHIVFSVDGLALGPAAQHTSYFKRLSP